MRTWSAVSQKGGSGKTTILAHLSVYAVQCGERVLLIDLDPQESAKQWHRLRGDSSEAPAVLSAVADNLDKILDAARTLGITLAMVDTAGKTDAGSVAAIRAADLIMTPTQPTFFATEALKDTVGLITRVGKLEQAVCIVNQLPDKRGEEEFKVAEMQAQRLGIAVSPAFLVHRRSYQTSLGAGKGITEFRPKDKKAIPELETLWAHLNTLNPIKAVTPANARG